MIQIGVIVLTFLCLVVRSLSYGELQSQTLRYEMLIPIPKKNSNSRKREYENKRNTISLFNSSWTLLSSEVELVKVKFPHLRDVYAFNETVRTNIRYDIWFELL